MAHTRFPLLECISPPAVAARTINTVTFPGYALWPGGDVVHVGATAYPDGVYGVGAPQRTVLADGAAGNFVDMSPGLQEQPGYLWTTPAPVQGVNGPAYLFQTPAWTPAQVAAGVTFTLRARYISGYFVEYTSGGALAVSNPWGVKVGRPDQLFVDGSAWSAPDSQVVTKLADGDYEFSMGIRPPYTAATGLSIIAYLAPASSASLWQIYDLWTDLTPLGGSWPLRQRQVRTGTPGWPLRQRQNGAHSGSWPLRQRQTGR